jgi:hypothetical protein
MTSLQVGTATGRRRGADQVAYGLGLGVESEVYLLRSPAIGLYLGAHWAAHPWFEQEIVADGYAPFVDTARLNWIELGISTRLRPRDDAP